MLLAVVAVLVVIAVVPLFFLRQAHVASPVTMGTGSGPTSQSTWDRAA